MKNINKVLLKEIAEKIAELEARRIAYVLQGDVRQAHQMLKSIRIAKKVFNGVSDGKRISDIKF